MPNEIRAKAHRSKTREQGVSGLKFVNAKLRESEAVKSMGFAETKPRSRIG
jgi:hypothetical protein